MSDLPESKIKDTMGSETKPIRILHWGLTNSRGGIESFIMDLYRNIDRTKVQFDFLEDYNMDKLIYEDEIIQMGGHIYRVLYSLRENYKKSRICMIEFLKEHPEIIGIHVHANFLYGALLRDAKKAGLSIRILHSHNIKPYEKESIKTKLRNYIVRKQINKYPTDYLACSDQAAEYMFPGKEFVWVKNGIDVNKFDYNVSVRNEMRSQLVVENKTVIGFVGNLRMQKNPFFVIDIFEQYHIRNKESVLLMIGEGKLEEELKRYAKDKHLMECVFFLGARKDIEKLYQAMDLFLFPSLFEGFGMVVVEAQTSGLPCIVSNTVPLQAKVTNLVKYLSVDDDSEQWAKEIEKSLSGFVREGKKAEIYSAGFDMARVAEIIEKYYLDLSFKIYENK